MVKYIKARYTVSIPAFLIATDIIRVVSLYPGLRRRLGSLASPIANHLSGEVEEQMRTASIHSSENSESGLIRWLGASEDTRVKLDESDRLSKF